MTDPYIKTKRQILNTALDEHFSANLGLITKRLNNHFKGLEADKLPEYKKAIDSLKQYEEAMIKSFDKKFK